MPLTVGYLRFLIYLDTYKTSGKIGIRFNSCFIVNLMIRALKSLLLINPLDIFPGSLMTCACWILQDEPADDG